MGYITMSGLSVVGASLVRSSEPPTYPPEPEPMQLAFLEDSLSS